ncbi:DUF1932 domain-containing protein [Thermodesulfobacteriota bacterium]
MDILKKRDMYMVAKKQQKIGFIGFGEVGRTFSHRMIEMGGDVFAYDKFPDRVAKKAAELKIPLYRTLGDLIDSCDIILSSLWPDVALDTAKEAAQSLSSRKIYCDLNSISPETTSEIQKVISASNADFVKIAIMAAIPDRGFEAPLLVGGTKSEEIAEFFSKLGLNIRAIGLDPRQPAAIKILRSICLKGIVALAYEMLNAAEKYGVVEQVFESASEVMSRSSFKETAENWLASTAIHARRRAKEMEEVIETLEALGIHPVMSLGTKKIFEEIADFNLDKVFQGQIPESFSKFIEAINGQVFSQ